MTIEQLFFELIRVAIGTQTCLSRQPSAKDWNALYDMAKKQSLVGVCFAGVQKLHAQRQEPPELQYLTWMGMAAKIQQRNEVVNRQCVDLQRRLADEGYRSCILKGQGVGQQYAEHLRGLRQSGDIDIWIEGGVEATVKLAESLGQKAEVTEQHVGLDVFPDTEVETHFIPSMLRQPFANRRLQRWFEEQVPTQFENRNEAGLCVPTVEFNLVYLLIHIYRHLFGEGVGLRQVMDYYFVLLNANKEVQEVPVVLPEGQAAKPEQEVLRVLKSLGLMEFAGGLMYVMREVFGLQREQMLCEPNERHGRSLLNEIMLSGNMGHYDERTKMADRSTRWKRFWLMNRHNLRLISYYPGETLWAPFARIKVWAWRKWNGWI